MEELQRFLVKGRSRLNVQQDKALIITGSTGVGKSTLSHLFGNSKVLSVETPEYDMQLKVDESDPRKIGHNLLESETTIPNLFQRIVKTPNGLDGSNVHGIHNIWDTPGYSDTGDQETKSYIKEIANSFYTCHLINNIDKIKILFVTSEDSLSNAKCKFFIESLENLAKMFQDVNILKNSVAICINKVRERKIKMNPRSLFEPLLNGSVLSENAKQILRFTEHSTHVFEKIDGQGEVTDDGLYERIMDSIKEYLDIKGLKSKYKSSIVNMTISQQGYNLAKPLLEESQQALRDALSQFTDLELLKKHQLIENFGQSYDECVFFKKLQRRYERGDTFIENFGGMSKEKKRLMMEQREMYSNILYLDDICTLNDILKCFDIDNLKVIEIKLIVKNMFEIYDRNSFSQEQDDFLIKQQDKINEKLEFISFIMQIKIANSTQGASMDHDLDCIKTLFQDFKQALSNREQEFINNYKIDVNGLNPNLYQKIFDILNRDRFLNGNLQSLSLLKDTTLLDGEALNLVAGYQDSEMQDRVTLLKAKCRIEMIKIQFAEDNYTECVKMIEESIKLFRNSSSNIDLQTFQILANLIYIDHEYVETFKDDAEVLDQLFKVLRFRLHKSVEESKELLNHIGIQNMDKYDNSAMALLQDLNKLRVSLNTLWKNNFQTNEQFWKKTLIQQYKKTFNSVLDVINARQLCLMTPEMLSSYNDQIKLKFEMNLLALNEIFKKKQSLLDPMNSSNQKQLQRQLDKLTDWVHILDSTQQRLENEQRELIDGINVEPEEVEKYTLQEIEDLIQITSSMPQSSHVQKCYAKCLLCKGIKTQVKEPQNEQDQQSNKHALEYFMSALKHDNGLNIARKLIADLHFQEGRYENAANIYNEINNFIQAELSYKMICERDPSSQNVAKLADYQRQIGLYNDAKRSYLEAIQLCSGGNFKFDNDTSHELFKKLEQVRKEEQSSLNVFEEKAQNKELLLPTTQQSNIAITNDETQSEIMPKQNDKNNS